MRRSLIQGDGSGGFRAWRVGVFGNVGVFGVVRVWRTAGMLGAIGIFRADLNAFSSLDEEVDEKVDRSAHVTVGVGDIGTTTGYRDDGEDGAKRDFIFACHDGLHHSQEAGSELSVIIERAGEGEEVVWCAVVDVIGLEDPLELVDGVTEAREGFLRVREEGHDSFFDADGSWTVILV